MAALGALGVAQGGDRRLHHPLRVRLADVDDVEHLARVAERRRGGLAGVAGRAPEDVAVGIGAVAAVPEVPVDEAQLPELVGDVLARVRDDSIGPDDDLVLVELSLGGVGRLAAHGQDPAAGHLAFGLQPDGPGFLQQREGAVPEVQAQDVALVGEQVVPDVEALHRREVAVHDRGGDEGGELRGGVPALLDLVERLGLQLPVGGIGGVEVPDLRIEVPAVVVEARRRGQGAHLGRRLALEVLEAHHDVRDLHAGVVDVVLHPDLAAAILQDAHEGVAEDRVAQVADVGGLVGVDARVLDDGAGARSRGPPGLGQAVVDAAQDGAPLQEDVDVAAARDLRLAHAVRPRRGRPESRSATSRGFRRRVLARSKGAVMARSPSSGRGGYWKVTDGSGTSNAALTAARTESERFFWMSRIIKPPKEL